MNNDNEIARRRTFAIVSHPDAGKTTLTEKLLLFGGQIQVAGAVKSNKIRKTATSDWMEIEKQRGISVTTSVMEFDYEGYKINILDTPGHQDFAEDTFRTLTAVDSVIIVIDSAKGVEAQTRKLMEVCRMRKTPVIIFANKMDREGKDPFELLDELEEELHIHVLPLSWPIEQGPRFKGVYNRYERRLDLYQPSKQVVTEKVEVDVNSHALEEHIGEHQAEQLRADLELIEGVYPVFDVESYLAADIAPVFFGSALNNFGVKELLNCFVKIAPSPHPVQAVEREVSPSEEKFTGFIFKITANIDPNHRSCVAFCKVCSGKFYEDMARWSFNLQIYFLNKRFQDVVEISRCKDTIVQDRTIFEDARIFAPNLHDMGLMSDRDFANYSELFDLMMSLVGKPDLLIYIRASIPHLIAQIQKRGREYEQGIRIDYLNGLNERYENWIGSYEGRLLVVDGDNLDFQNNPRDFQSITDQIDAELFGLFADNSDSV